MPLFGLWLFRDCAPSWLSSHGVAVLTYDYRYMGLSWPPEILFRMRGPGVGAEAEAGRNTLLSREEALNLVPDDITISEHWAKRDAAAATRFAAKRWPGVPLTSLGHSLGGRTSSISQISEVIS